MDVGSRPPARLESTSCLRCQSLDFSWLYLGRFLALSKLYVPGTYDLQDDKVTDEAGLAVIEQAFKLGINLLDTADVYGAGHNEKLVGMCCSHIKTPCTTQHCCVVFMIQAK